MAEFTLTIREGPRVERERYGDLEEALAALQRGVERVKSEGGLPTVKMLREFNPSQRVKARLEISTGGMLRRREAGVDVMGDGRVVPYRGSAWKRHLDPAPEVGYREAVGEALDQHSRR